MGGILEETLRLPHVSAREPPVVGPEGAEVDDGVRRDATREIDVGVDVAECEVPGRSKDWSAAVQSGVA